MIHLRKYSYLILWGALIATVGLVWLFGGRAGENGGTQQSPQPPASSAGQPSAAPTQEPTFEPGSAPVSAETEMAGLWVPYMSLTTEEKTQAAFEENFKKIADSAKTKGITALFVHVRPYGDALYPSDFFPWSHILTGEQGKDPGYDPLAFMVSYTHELGMAFHAWINPLRIQSGDSTFELSSGNLYNQLKDDSPFYFMNDDGGIYLNPAYPYVRSLIADGAAEIVSRYEVDGIHFDDYFYPSEDEALDSDAYAAYASGVSEPLALAQWRTGNINAMVAEVYQKIKAACGDAVFGISPTGNIENDEKMNADVKTWCAIPGYLDYICPQIYYSYDNPALGYGAALSQWTELPRHSSLRMYIGLALYKAGSDADSGTWQPADDQIARQIQDSRSVGANGVILYSAAYLDIPQTEKEVQNAVALLQPETED